MGQCGTRIPGGTVVNTTWSLAGSPYCVSASIMVGGLTIEPGVEVRFNKAASMTVATTLLANGTAQRPIVFKEEAANEGWLGVRFDNTSGVSSLKHCRITEATSGALRIINSTPIVESCVIESNSSTSHGGGLYIVLGTGQSITVRDTAINHNTSNKSLALVDTHGGGAYLSGKVTLLNCQVIGNTSQSRCYASHCHSRNYGGGVFASGQVSILNCLIRGNASRAYSRSPTNPSQHHAFSHGGGIYSAGGDLTVRNSIVSSNDAYAECTGSGFCGWTTNTGGIHVAGGTALIENSTIVSNRTRRTVTGGITAASSTVTVRNSICYGNQGGQIAGAAKVEYSVVQGGHVGVGNLDKNPFLFGSDCELITGPPCQDAGDPDSRYNDGSLPPSLGGVRNDIGALGGPDANLWHRSTIMSLVANPTTVVTPGRLELKTAGGDPGCPSMLFVTAVGGVTLPDPLPVPALRAFCADRTWTLRYDVPKLGQGSATLRAFSLDYGNSLVISPPATVTIR